VRIDIRRIGAIKQGEAVIGNRTRVKIVKNKMAPPFKDAELDILYNEGISKESDLIDLGVQTSIVEKSGAWFSYNGNRIGQGREAARLYLKEHRDTASVLEEKVLQHFGIKGGHTLKKKEA